MTELPDYASCKYSLFVSYVHADDTQSFGFIGDIAEAITMRLAGIRNEGFTTLGVHISAENGPSSGALADRLNENMLASFAVLLVISEGYANSQWCRHELKYFRERFGVEGLKRRLFIAVLSGDALKRVEALEEWRGLVPDSQLWVPFYQPGNPQALIRARLDSGAFAHGFVEQASRLGDDLKREILANLARTKLDQTQARVSGAQSPSTPWTQDEDKRLRVAIGPCTEDLAARADELAAALQDAGAEVTRLDVALMNDYDPEDGRPLRPRLAEFDALVAPISDARPLVAASGPGGHASILAREWQDLKKTRPVVWFRPGGELPEEMRATEKHRAVFATLAPVSPSVQAVVDLLFGFGVERPIKVHIEKGEHSFRSLSRCLEKVWRSLPPEPRRPALRCAQLDFTGLRTACKDAAGMVLLRPVIGNPGEPTKSVRALEAQVAEVEKEFQKAGKVFPGCVVIAVLYEQPTEPRLDENEYEHFRVRRPDYQLEGENELALKEFLRDIWERHLDERNDSRAAAPRLN